MISAASSYTCIILSEVAEGQFAGGGGNRPPAPISCSAFPDYARTKIFEISSEYTTNYTFTEDNYKIV